MTTEDIEHRFSSPAFTEAAGILEMIARTPQERSQYEARLKAQRDERARMEYAVEQARIDGRAEGKAEGKAEGEARGKAIGRIEVLRDLLAVNSESLDGLTLEQLASLESDLQRQLRDRGV